MNIQSAKKQIKNTIEAYRTKRPDGTFVLSQKEQRPVILIGPPGIGKTDIMEQIAEELGINLVSYSMTHHTRQSALGLPIVRTKEFDGKSVDVTEYTMSEIISTIYERMEETGIREGILFLDEINCVSETLTPVMLEFLQYKVFGKHKVPDGWIVVTAGNPREFNRYARDFDVVTWDRLKRIDVEPDYQIWRKYASEKGIPMSIISYLDSKTEFFYRIRSTEDGMSYVTARSWTDLGKIMRVYESIGIEVDGELISQYVRDEEIALEFGDYYALYRKYKSDYRLEDILAGREPEEIRMRAKAAPYDERMMLAGLMTDQIREKIRRQNDDASACISNVYAFMESAFGDGPEILMFTTELTVNMDSALYLMDHANAAYDRHSEELMFAERGLDLKKRVEEAAE